LSGDGKRRPFVVFELHREEGEVPANVPHRTRKPPVKFTTTDIGCYFARSGEEACKKAALVEDRLVYFVAVEAVFPKIVFDTSRYSRRELRAFTRRDPTAANQG
jgi:hypothetical protein